MDLRNYRQIVDHDKLQVYETFIPYSKRDPHAGSYYLWVIGDESHCQGWMDRYKTEYHPAGYGTNFTESLDHSTPECKAYQGYRAHSCD